VLFSYFVLRVFFRPIFSAVVISSLEFGLSVAHVSKVSIINEALVWRDLIQPNNLSIIARYLTPAHALLMVFFLTLNILAFKAEHHRIPYSWRIRRRYFLLSLTILPLLFYLKYIQANLPGTLALKNYLEKQKVLVFYSDWVKSVKLFGLPYHLVHTSQTKLPTPPTQAEKEEFKRLLEKKNQIVFRPKNILYILCESCWHDEINFKGLFKPLRDRGFQNFSAISPVYGGSTVNAAFEVLTGLPSRTDSLNGVIYQEYASTMRKQVHALPRYLSNLGYTSIALHNNDRNFWSRNIINPKFGFERFIGLQDMNYKGPLSGWADDSILFDSALEVFRESGAKPHFFYLTSVYTHGPYQEVNGDLGVSDYRLRLSKTISELVKFIDAISKTDPNSLIVIFGDHKPSLTKFFQEHGIFSDNPFDSRGSWERVGEVPVYIRNSDQKRVSRVVKSSSGLPFFCMSQAIDQEFLQSGVPAFQFSQERKLCLNDEKKEYRTFSRAYPDWLYSLSLFNDKNPSLTLRLHSLLDF
jgi:hypothetical protein